MIKLLNSYFKNKFEKNSIFSLLFFFSFFHFCSFSQQLPLHNQYVYNPLVINPAFAGKMHEWKKKYPEWGAFRKTQIDIMINSQTLNAIVFAHNKDKFEDQETLSFLKNFKDLNFVDYSDLKPTSCTWADVDRKMESDKGHSIPQSKCFTTYVEKNNYFINYIETLF